MRKARFRLGLTLLQVAQKCEALGVPISESALSRIERRQAAGHPKTRAVLAEVLGLDAAHDFKKSPPHESTDPPPADVDVRVLRGGERAVPDGVPELPDARVGGA